MKKTKLLGLAALLLSMGMTACDLGGGGGTDTGTDDGKETWVSNQETHYKVDGRGKRLSAAEPHTLVDYEGDPTHVNTPATCSAPGIVYKQCTVCEKIISQDVKKLTHEFEIDPDKNTATCTEAGTLVQKCKYCGKEESKATEALGHKLGTATTPKTGVSKAACEREGCDASVVVLDVSKATGWNKADTKMSEKSGDNSKSTWDVSGVIDDGKYDIEIEGLMSYKSHGDRYWYNMYETDTASSPDTAEQDPFRYFFKVNDATINPNVLDKTWEQLGYKGSDDSGTPTYGYVCKGVDIAGANSFSLVHGNIGFSMIISNVRLTKVA